MSNTMTYSTIWEILDAADKKYSSEEAVRYRVSKDGIEAKTYGQLKQDSDHFSCVLRELGELGNHIALTGMTSYTWITAFLGITGSGCVAVPLDVALPAEEMCELIHRSDATVLVLDEVRGDVGAMVRERCPKIRYVLSMQKEKAEGGMESFWELVNAQKGSLDHRPELEDLCTIMFTSGTTGKSKGVMLTQRNIAENATCLDMKFPERTVILSVLPIHHAYCLSMDIIKGISLGSVICINDSLMHMAKNMKIFQPDMILMVPLMIETLAKKLEAAEGLPPEAVRQQVFGENLHTICSGGAYLNPDYIDLFERYGIRIQQGYGMTECAPVISTNLSWNIRKDSVGQLMPNCEAKVVEHELWIRGSSVMAGYYKMPKETAETLEDGWLKTGDLGYVDEEGFVYLTGRKKNLIITKNGENVSPEELENKIGTSRLVQEILVRESEGVIEAEIFPDQEYVIRKQIHNVEKELQKIIDEYNAGAPTHKRIYRLKIRDQEFEKTPSKKIKR